MPLKSSIRYKIEKTRQDKEEEEEEEDKEEEKKKKRKEKEEEILQMRGESHSSHAATRREKERIRRIGGDLQRQLDANGGDNSTPVNK